MAKMNGGWLFNKNPSIFHGSSILIHEASEIFEGIAFEAEIIMATLMNPCLDRGI